jgi:glutamine synthetase
MTAAPLAAIVTTDLTAITRGRFLPADRLAGAVTGIGWVPANISLLPSGVITADDGWGSSGDIRIVPDLKARAVTSLTGAPTPFDMTPGDIVNLDGSPWPACARTALRQAIAEFTEATGLKLLATFEQEFQLLNAQFPDAHPFAFDALRRAEPFAGQYFAALTEAGVAPEMLISEYGLNQFEVVAAPTDALGAADRAVVIREIAREMARLRGWRATFAPKTAPHVAGNGVHIHFSLVDAAGAPAGFDPERPGRLSPLAAAFAAGVLAHLPEILALTAPNPSSYLRLRPHNWSSAWTWLGDCDREATLRICPTVEFAGKDPAKQFNLEYRAADATANPYLALAAILRAGLDGVRRDLPAPPVFSGDPAALSSAEREKLGLHRLPETLTAALDLFETSAAVKSWFAPELIKSFACVKRAEIAAATGLSEAELCESCARYY